MAFSDLEIRNAWEDSLASGFSPEQIYQNALANFGVTREQVDRALANTSNISNKAVQGLFQEATPSILEQVQELTATSQAGYNPEMAYTPVGQFQVDGKTVTVNPDGSFYALEELGGGNIAQQIYSPAGELVDQSVYNREESTYLTPVVNALMAAAGGAVLGPYGAKLLSTPLAAAVGSGGTSLLRGGSVEDALKSAVLSGLGAYGVETLFPTAAYTAGDTAVNLVSSGGTVDSITNALVNTGVPASTARLIAVEALAGSSASQIAADFAGLTLGGGTAAATTGAVVPSTSNLVNVLGSSLPATTGTGLFSTAAGSLLGAGIGSTLGTMGPITTAPVEVTSPRTTETTGTTIAPSLGAVLSTTTTAPVEVEGTRVPREDTQVLRSVIPPVVPSVVPPTVPSVVTSTTPVEVTGVRDTTAGTTLGSLLGVGAGGLLSTAVKTPQVEIEATRIPKDTQVVRPVIPPVVTAPTVTPTTTTTTPTTDNTLSLTNLLSLLSLFGSLGGSLTGNTTPGTTTTTTTPISDPLLGTTTPQYGSDYYNAVQRYYNAYMPETPRDVAGPLQQWYENTYGTAPATGPGVGSAPAVMPGGMFTTPQVTTPTQPGPDRGITPVMKPQGVAPQTSKQQSFMGPEYFQALLENPQYGGQVYGTGIQPIGGLPPGLSQEALAKLFPQGTSKYVPQEVSVSIPDYFGYISGSPEFDTLFEKARASQRAFSRVGADPAQQEYEMKNYLNNLAGGMAMTGGVSQGAKPLLPLLTSLDTSSGRMTSEQADALQFIVSNAENYNRLKQDIPVWEKEGNTAYLANQKPYFEQLGKALRDYSKKLEGLDTSKLSSKELFSLIPSGI